MEFKFKFKNTTGDFFVFNMSNIYSQWTALVNIIFTVAMILLIVSRWGDSHIFFKGVMVFGLILFPVIQPLCIYLRSAKQAESITESTELTFDDGGMHIRVKDHDQLIKWKDYKTTINRPFILISIPDGKHAYILTDRILKDKRKALYKYINGECCGAK
ncbi:MAG: hypothetical protein K6G87_06775 [Butyrivibrio sp.]|uniref:hypothetical protein n=1 Tax=Butyrivibrio sp. TaxID=28121 RepID=UPI0025CBC3AE|nr:hypothetical protein [Butyrivibrio sp.]MCR5770923.1 hypothetical protein [Butyrivibrio sp.]